MSCPFHSMFEMYWPPAKGCGWQAGHDLQLTFTARLRLETLQPWVVHNQIYLMHTGARPGVVCARCGMTAAELQLWPAAQCVVRKKLAERAMSGEGIMDELATTIRRQSS